MFTIKKIITGIFKENTYLIYNNKNVIIIDPGDDYEKIDLFISDNQLLPKAILGTHGHIDHISSVYQLKEKYKIPFYLNSKEKINLDHLEEISNRYNIKYFGTPEIDIDLQKEDEISIDEFKFKIIQSPGHTYGGVLFKIDNIVFCGDTIFKNSIGRTDLPGGDIKILKKTILEKIYTLSEDTKLYPGHLEITTVKHEKYNNQYVHI
ncbi:MAG: MBL fold metallo-hydrolase [Candidatus Marinimicrobia bacterium]|jgi:hydroxyacylglutathione hydrolase|nr:MBL fold metallo-hydrolase [Candidatus Neomarinimicrobiota bacterium]